MVKTIVTKYLAERQIGYKLYNYIWQNNQMVNPDTTTLDFEERQKIFKTLVLIGNNTGILVAVLPISKEISLKKLAILSGNKRVELLPLEELKKTTGYIRGGCSPIAMKRLYPTFIDQSAQEKEVLIVSAGRRDLQVELDSKQLAKLTKGSFADLLL